MLDQTGNQKMTGYVMKECEQRAYSPGSSSGSSSDTHIHIPGLMSHIKESLLKSSVYKEEPLSLEKGLFVNKEDLKLLSDTIQESNSISIKSSRNEGNKTPSRLQKGESVKVERIDGDPTNLKYTSEGTNEHERTSDYYRVFVTDRNTVNDSVKEYEFLMDSEEKIIRIQTSDGRNEFDIYTFIIDADNGTVKVQDTKGNEWYLDSKLSNVGIRNSSGSKIETYAENINLNCKGTVNINATNVKINCDTKILGNVSIRDDVTIRLGDMMMWKGDLTLIKGDVNAMNVYSKIENSPKHFH